MPSKDLFLSSEFFNAHVNIYIIGENDETNLTPNHLPTLDKRRSNYNAILHRKIEETTPGIHILGGEIVNSEDIQSDSEYADISTVDKNDQNTESKFPPSKKLNSDDSRSKQLF
jgi:hypothetical protein